MMMMMSTMIFFWLSSHELGMTCSRCDAYITPVAETRLGYSRSYFLDIS